jgi:hypothetical protein
MVNRRTWISHWHHELQEEDQVALENSANGLHICLNNLSVQMLTIMELLVEQY